jgi:hypothetical protein
MSEDTNEPQVLAEEDFAAIQGSGERRILVAIPTLMILLSIVGLAGATMIPRGGFRGGCLAAFGGALFLGASMYICLWIAYRGRSMAAFHPNERFIPSVIAGCAFQVFLFFLSLLAVQSLPTLLTGWDLPLFYLILINGTRGSVWDALVIRRSRLDGAWTGRRR